MARSKRSQLLNLHESKEAISRHHVRKQKPFQLHVSSDKFLEFLLHRALRSNLVIIRFPAYAGGILQSMFQNIHRALQLLHQVCQLRYGGPLITPFPLLAFSNQV